MKILSSIAYLASALSLAASPITIYSSFGPEQSYEPEESYIVGRTYEGDIPGIRGHAQSFVSDGDYVMTSAKVALGVDVWAAAMSEFEIGLGSLLTASVWSNSDDQPFTKLIEVGVPEIPDGLGVVDADFGEGIQLELGVQYWLALEAASADSFASFYWFYTVDGNESYGATYHSYLSGEPQPIEWSSFVSNEAAFSIHGTAIPEPSMYAVGATALILGIALYRRRNR